MAAAQNVLVTNCAFSYEFHRLCGTWGRKHEEAAKKEAIMVPHG